MDNIKISQKQLEKLKKTELEILIELDRICRKYNIKYTLGYGTLLGAIRHKGFIPWDDDVDVCMLRKEYNRFREVCKEELGEAFFYQSNETDPEYFHLFDKIRANNTIFKETYLAKYNIHHGVYIDIFPIDYIPSMGVRRKIQLLKFHFFRAGLMAKYLDCNARKGWKKYAAICLKIFYAPFSVKSLYSSANRVAVQYNLSKENIVAYSFGSPYKGKDSFPVSYFEQVIDASFEGKKFFIPTFYDDILSNIYGDYMKYPPEKQRLTRHDLLELRI